MVSSYGLDGEGAALGAQLISVLQSAGIGVLDSRASFMVTGGFDNGVHLRGPATENTFIFALRDALTNIGKLEVWVNRPVRTGSLFAGGGMSYPEGTVFVSIMVGIKPAVPILAK